MSDSFEKLTPKSLTIKNLLNDKNLRYLIPDYQREYRWREEECDKLWDDLTVQFDVNREGHYFLGSIIAHRVEGRLHVIDGQQRLISLSILLRQLFGKIYGERLATNTEAEFFQETDMTVDDHGNQLRSLVKRDETRNPYRIVSDVLGEHENDMLRHVLDLDHSTQKPHKFEFSRYGLNSVIFADRINEFTKPAGGDMAAARKLLVDFAEHIQNNVYLLLIETLDFEDAWTIFDTVNNRGMQLADGDIIKAKLNKQARTDKREKEFSERWAKIAEILGEDEENGSKTAEKSKIEKLLTTPRDKQFSAMTELFRVYMHALRAKAKHKHDLVGLRSFFIDGKDKNKDPQLAGDFEGGSHKIGDKNFPWTKVIADLERLASALRYAVSDTNPQLLNWITAIQTLGKRECFLPILVWLFKNIECKDDETTLPKDKWKECNRFCSEIVRLSFAFSISGRQLSANRLSEASASVYSADTVIPWEYVSENSARANISELVQLHLQDKKPPYALGLVYLLELLNHKNVEVIDLGEVEHILPVKHKEGTRPGWNEEEANTALHQLGILVLITKPENIRASNYAFVDKVKEYRKYIKYETLNEVACLPKWTPDEFRERQQKSINQLLEFLRVPPAETEAAKS